MRVFIELPTWLGDAVMASAAVESIALNLAGVQFVFFGSFAACELYREHPNAEFIVIDESKKAKSRKLWLIKTARKLGKFDAAISFRSSFASKILLFFIKAKKKFRFKKSTRELHQVLKYLNFAKNALNLEQISDALKLHFEPIKFKDKILALNPGATYGSAKRWYPHYFAQVAQHFAGEYKIIIFGGGGESEICGEIEQILASNGIKCENLAGKTSVKQLAQMIAGVGGSGGVFITNDSGPMHIAAAYKVPTIALFGPTKFNETGPWQNQNAHLLHLNLACMPCMKRTCPLGTHECMKSLTPQAVISAIEASFTGKI